MGAKLLGAHMPAAGGLHKALIRGKEIGCTAVQVFTSSPQQWKAKEVTQEMVDAFKDAQRETGLSQVVSHDSYLINLSSADEEHRAKSINGLTNEMLRSARFGIPFVVSHIGARTGQPEEVALKKACEGIEQVLANTPDEVALLMETTAGQGSALNSKFEEIGAILNALKSPKRLAVCVDTCHIFVAGYDLRTAETYGKTFEAFDHIVGIEKIKAIHCNDSKKGLGSKVDRHAHIGEGEIGAEGFKLLVNDPRFENTPILLETPDAEEWHRKNLDTLKSYISPNGG